MFHQQITLIPSPEIDLYHIYPQVFTQLHLALVELGKAGHKNVGILFPDYVAKLADTLKSDEKPKEITLGNVIRVFAPSAEILEKLNLKDFLNRLTDYMHLGAIKPVPTEKIKGYAWARRCRFKNLNSKEGRLTKITLAFQAHQLKKHGRNISLEQAELHCKTHKAQGISGRYPFINIKSQTNAQVFQLGIIQESFLFDETNDLNALNTLGLNQQAMKNLFNQTDTNLNNFSSYGLANIENMEGLNKEDKKLQQKILTCLLPVF